MKLAVCKVRRGEGERGQVTRLRFAGAGGGTFNSYGHIASGRRRVYSSYFLFYHVSVATGSYVFSV